MAEQFEENAEISKESENGYRSLLVQAKYWLDYYVGHDTDLTPICTAQTLLEKALALTPETEDELNKGFGVSSLSKVELIEAGFPRALVLSLTDNEMSDIAASMGDAYTTSGYWEDLETAAKRTFRAKAEEDALNPSGEPLSAFRDEDGKFISFADGGYPCYYLDSEYNVLCPDCANKKDMATPIIAGDVYWEGAAMDCEHCGKDIESAYGNPNTEK